MGLKVGKYATCEKDALAQGNCIRELHHGARITEKRGEGARENKTPGPAQLASGCLMAPGQTPLFQNAETNPTVNLFAFSSMS